MKSLFFRSVLVILLANVLGACHVDKSQPNFDLIQDFMESPALKAQEYDPATAKSSKGSDKKPTGTVPLTGSRTLM